MSFNQRVAFLLVIAWAIDIANANSNGPLCAKAGVGGLLEGWQGC